MLAARRSPRAARRAPLAALRLTHACGMLGLLFFLVSIAGAAPASPVPAPAAPTTLAVTPTHAASHATVSTTLAVTPTHAASHAPTVSPSPNATASGLTTAERLAADAARKRARRAAETEAQTAARKDADAARAAARRAAPREYYDGDLYLAAPVDMPLDSYFDTFETNPIAAQSFFWARSYNWQFERWRTSDFSAMSAADGADLKLSLIHI